MDMDDKTLVNVKKSITIIWKQLRMMYDREAAINMLEESFITKYLEFKVGTLGYITINWHDNYIKCINSEEGTIFLQEEIYKNK